MPLGAMARRRSRAGLSDCTKVLGGESSPRQKITE